VDVADAVRDAVATQRREAEARGLDVQLDLDDGTLVFADETRLDQVFANLMQNSLRYTDAPGRIAVAVKADGDRVVVDWQDSAPGVTADELPRLTERLYRVETSRSRASGGSGLGLAIARAIVEGHGGALNVVPSPLGGLGVRLVFPRWTGDGRG
jgi:two-component system sensor histidine kinase BaeS